MSETPRPETTETELDKRFSRLEIGDESQEEDEDAEEGEDGEKERIPLDPVPLDETHTEEQKEKAEYRNELAPRIQRAIEQLDLPEGLEQADRAREALEVMMIAGKIEPEAVVSLLPGGIEFKANNEPLPGDFNVEEDEKHGKVDYKVLEVNWKVGRITVYPLFAQTEHYIHHFAHEIAHLEANHAVRTDEKEEDVHGEGHWEQYINSDEYQRIVHNRNPKFQRDYIAGQHGRAHYHQEMLADDLADWHVVTGETLGERAEDMVRKRLERTHDYKDILDERPEHPEVQHMLEEAKQLITFFDNEHERKGHLLKQTEGHSGANRRSARRALDDGEPYSSIGSLYQYAEPHAGGAPSDELLKTVLDKLWQV